MSIYTDIQSLADGKSKSKSWYREQLIYGLQGKGDIIAPGDLIFFSYSAATADKMPFYDRWPLVMVTDVDYTNQTFTGGNIHYLRPTLRKAVGRSWAGGNGSYPKKCFHKYLMSNVGSIYEVPRTSEWNDVGLLPVEDFVRTVGSRSIQIPSRMVW